MRARRHLCRFVASVVCNRVPSVWTRASEGKQSRPSAIIRPRTLTPRYLVGTSRPRWRRVQIRSRTGNAFLVEIFLFFVFPVHLTGQERSSSMEQEKAPKKALFVLVWGVFVWGGSTALAITLLIGTLTRLSRRMRLFFGSSYSWPQEFCGVSGCGIGPRQQAAGKANLR